MGDGCPVDGIRRATSWSRAGLAEFGMPRGLVTEPQDAAEDVVGCQDSGATKNPALGMAVQRDEREC